MKDMKKATNKHQHKLIVLISTLNYINIKLKKYNQSDILYYFNNNLENNQQKKVTLKTLQSYLYKLEKEFQVTSNYYKHLGENRGTEIHYKLKHHKKVCHYKINKYFKEKKEERFQKRANSYHTKSCNNNGNVEKWESIYNYNNKKNKEEEKKEREQKQLEKYAEKCKFKDDKYLSILNLEATKEIKIKKLIELKKEENKRKKEQNKSRKLVEKQKELEKTLTTKKEDLEKEGYDKKQLEIEMQKAYGKYKDKPHFIIESSKYGDLGQIVKRIKRTVECKKKEKKEDRQQIKDNIFSILLDQLRDKIEVKVLASVLKNYLNKQNDLKYSKVFNNHYYYELLTIIKEKNYLGVGKYKKIVD
ncbi:plasmid maintenance protein [Borrelia crocidurae]|uniref:Plasmid partitioning associated protein 2 n=1 Tax=Borrelia crocidurae (strain Achema) TaxID=1155096 RepID=I0FF30_BORCA|nr:plasmid maintenance protein [Borrelia crocidurae]AFI32086.1 Plasmid partitioning associated protein 2 [Borrelia crocidurae str. Achema]